MRKPSDYYWSHDGMVWELRQKRYSHLTNKPNNDVVAICRNEHDVKALQEMFPYVPDLPNISQG